MRNKREETSESKYTTETEKKPTKRGKIVLLTSYWIQQIDRETELGDKKE